MDQATRPSSTPQEARRRIATPTAAMIPRIGDSLSFLYLDMMRITQDDTGLLALPARTAPNRRLRVPTAAVSCLLLGPGTSITNPALATLARHGTTVVAVGSGAVRCYAAVTPAGQSSRWLEAQAAAWADPARRLDVARRMYHRRFPADDARLQDGIDLNTLRGLEGQRMKNLYRQHAVQHGLHGFKRSYDRARWEAQDPVNLALSTANTCLYGIVHAAISALGCTPGLGFVHTGTTHAFVYDIADLYKAELTIPLAFSLHASGQPDSDARRAFRSGLSLYRLMPRIVGDVQQLLDPDAGVAVPDETPEVVNLWDPQAGQVAGGVNYDTTQENAWPR